MSATTNPKNELIALLTSKIIAGNLTLDDGATRAKYLVMAAKPPLVLTRDFLLAQKCDVVFAVSRIYRGHGDITAEQKYRLVLTVKSPQSKRELEYTIPELNKEFTITLPDSLQELNKAYRLRAGEGGEPIALKIIVKADLK